MHRRVVFSVSSCPLLSQETRTSSESIISMPASSTSGSPSRVIYVSRVLSVGSREGTTAAGRARRGWGVLARHWHGRPYCGDGADIRTLLEVDPATPQACGDEGTRRPSQWPFTVCAGATVSTPSSLNKTPGHAWGSVGDAVQICACLRGGCSSGSVPRIV